MQEWARFEDAWSTVNTKNGIKRRIWLYCNKINMRKSVIKLVMQLMSVIFVIIYL